MSRFASFLAWLAIVCLTACAPRSVVPDQASGYPYRHSDFDYRVAWKTTQAANGIVVDGLLKNVRFENVDAVEVTLYLTGKDDTVRSSATAIPVPQHTRKGEVVPFSLTLKNVALAKGDLFRFLINYKANDGGAKHEVVEWRSTFIADAMTGKVVKDHEVPAEW